MSTGEELGVYERWKDSSEREYALARAMVVADARPIDICRKLSIPYDRAVRLHSKAHRELFVEGPTRMDPEADAALKDDLTHKLIKVVGVCDEAVDRSFEEGKGSTRQYGPLLLAAAQLCKLRGYNAPTRSLNLELKANARVSPEVHARIMADPQLLEAFLMLEEATSRPGIPSDEDGGGT